MCVDESIFLSAEAVEVVQSTWNALAPTYRQISREYLTRLLEISHEARRSFLASSSDIDHDDGSVRSHGRHFIAAVSMCVKGLQDQKKLAKEVKSLGRRHLLYDTSEGMYTAVGESLIQTLKEHLPELGWKDEAAWLPHWQAFFGLVLSCMTGKMVDAGPGRGHISTSAVPGMVLGAAGQRPGEQLGGGRAGSGARGGLAGAATVKPFGGPGGTPELSGSAGRGGSAMLSLEGVLTPTLCVAAAATVVGSVAMLCRRARV